MVLAIAEKVTELGGQIATSCRVESVSNDEEGKLILTCNMNGETFIQKAKSVAHCWNAYGAKDKFLPERLASQITNRRCQVVGLKNSGIKISKNMCYNQDQEDTEEFIVQRSDGTIILGGY